MTSIIGQHQRDYGYVLTCVRIVLEIAPNQRWVDFAFIPISKEETEMDIEREFAVLYERLPEE